MEYFIHGTPQTTFEQALRDNWPFVDRDIKSKLRIVTETGADVTNISSILMFSYLSSILFSILLT